MTDPQKPALVFVYNADSGVFNLVADIAHKIFSPATYACNLCAVTHSNFGMRSEWKDYLATLENPLEFLHADEFAARYGRGDEPLPAIFRRAGDNLSVLVAAAEIDRCRTIDELRRLLDARLG